MEEMESLNTTQPLGELCSITREVAALGSVNFISLPMIKGVHVFVKIELFAR